jgi:hypothetical protein
VHTRVRNYFPYFMTYSTHRITAEDLNGVRIVNPVPIFVWLVVWGKTMRPTVRFTFMQSNGYIGRPIWNKINPNFVYTINTKFNWNIITNFTYGRSEWPRGLRHEISWYDQTLGTPASGMDVCVHLSSALICEGDLTTADPPSKGSYELPIRFMASELILNWNMPDNLLRRGRIRRILHMKHKDDWTVMTKPDSFILCTLYKDGTKIN